jgi:hypothetical protein
MTDGTVYGTGSNRNGQLGTGNDTSVTTLTSMVMPVGKTAKSISTGNYFSLVLMTDGTVYGTGSNANGQLGTGNDTDVNSLTPMLIPSGKTAKSISAGYSYSILLMTDGTVYGTGSNANGQLGTGNNTDVNSLTPMLIPSRKTPKSISAGYFYSILLMTDGTVYGTGSNEIGQLGTGNNTDVNSLTPMINGTNVEYLMNESMYVELEPIVNPVPISNICFPAGTPFTTDQGIIAIEKINPKIHTIRKNEIVAITKTVTQDKYLVCFEKDSLGKNIPNQKTVITKNHKLFYKGNMMRAKNFVNDFENVKQIKYSGEFLYNVLLKKYDKIIVNNLVCETLHPENLVAKLYKILEPFNEEEQYKLIEKFNEYVVKNKYYSSLKK